MAFYYIFGALLKQNNLPFTTYKDMHKTTKTQHKGFSVTNIEVQCRRISAGTAVEAETGAAVIPLSSPNTRSYMILPYIYLQTAHELCSSSMKLDRNTHQLCLMNSIPDLFIF